jgi:hypothetical protein
MKLVEKADVNDRKMKSLQDLQSFHFQQRRDGHDYGVGDHDGDFLDATAHVTEGSEVEGLGMELKLYFDFGPVKGALLLVSG